MALNAKLVFRAERRLGVVWCRASKLLVLGELLGYMWRMHSRRQS